ncbi:hypothetical protein L6164_032212 [Bauhinia variegata]|uniref:Uncharacterized protein n=1 Tax=Bauhinia variegata TaxID=167791 RepID=A0ACB9KNF7_BAUVA|nr:hypothetical protein L6164_032212 [Bauhinia variegata]
MSPSVPVVVRRKHGIPVSPFFQRKLHKKHFTDAGNSSPVNCLQGFEKIEHSARKLAARLWQLRVMEVSGDGGAAFRYGSVQSSKSELESSTPCLRCLKEEATKWDPAISKASNKSTQELPENKTLISSSVVSTLLTELLRANGRINKLKAARKSSKKKVEQFQRKLKEESVVWKLRESEKIQAMIDDLNDKLARERRSRERMELLNSKLAQELAESHLSSKQIVKNYEEEKRSREIMEETCNELAKRVGEDKAKLEELEWESMKISEELEKERSMLQMADLWREERVQMKLQDAKNSFEDKYNEIIQLIAYLQNFPRSRGAELYIRDIMEAELIKQAAKSVNIQHVMEHSSDFSKSDDVFPIHEELRKHEANERVIKPCFLPCSPTGPSPTIHVQSYNEDGSSNNFGLLQLSAPAEYNLDFEANNITEETATLAEDQNKNILLNECKQRLPRNSINLGIGIASPSPCKGKGESGSRHRESAGQRNSRDAKNPHVTRGMLGCIEWPRGIPKTKSKAIPLEARVRTQKSQLQQLLKRRKT